MNAIGTQLRDRLNSNLIGTDPMAVGGAHVCMLTLSVVVAESERDLVSG